MVATIEDLIEFICQHHSEMTAKEISEATGRKVNEVYYIAYKHGLGLKHSDKKKYPAKKYDRSQCKGRPQSCFNCTNPECICRDKCTPKETAYLYIGAGDGTSSGKLKRAESEDNGI